MGLDGSEWRSADLTGCWGSFVRNPGRLIKDAILQFNLYPHDEILYDSTMLLCVGCVSVGFKA